MKTASVHASVSAPAAPGRRLPVRSGSERLLFVLSTLAHTGTELTFEDLLRKTMLPKSTLYRQLALLKRWGFVSSHDDQYAPGPMCVPLAWGFDNFSHLVQESQETLMQLRDESGESVGVLAAVDTRVVCVAMVQSTRLLRCSLTKGRSAPLCSGASAKALLAFMMPARRERILDGLVGSGVLAAAARASLERELPAIRKRGHAISSGEVDVGIWGASAPIFQTHSPYADAVVTVMAPTARTAGREPALSSMLQRAAGRITENLRQSHA